MAAAERGHRVLDGAKDDIRQAVRWYEQHVTGAGSALLLAFDEAITKVTQAPERWPRIDANYQRLVLRRYPYSVIYRMHEDLIFIVAIAHHSREPNFWRGREPPSSG